MAEDTITDEAITDQSAAKIEDGVQSPADADKDEGTVKRRFENQEEAEKAHREAVRRMTKANQEAARLREENQRFQAETLAKLVDAQAKKDVGQGASKQEIAARRQELISRLDKAEDSTAYVEFVEDAFGESREYSKREISAFKEQIEKLASEVQELRETSSPDYQKNKEKVEKVMKELGLPRQQAIKAVKMFASDDSTPAQSRDSSPGGLGSGGRRPETTRAKGASEEEIADFKRMNPTASEAEIAAVFNLKPAGRR